MKPAPQVVFQEVEGEMVLLDGKAEHYYALDEVGSRFWQLLGEHGDLDTVVVAMLTEFDVEEATLRADLEALIAKLTAAGLVVPGDPP